MAFKSNLFTPLASAARTANGNSDVFEFPESFDELLVYLDITAVSGTSPTMTVSYETSPDGTRWFTHTSFAAKTATGKDVLKLQQIGRKGRIAFTVGGTSPNFTFRVDVEGKRGG